MKYHNATQSMFQFIKLVYSINPDQVTIHITQNRFNQYLNTSFVLTNQVVTREKPIHMIIAKMSAVKFILVNQIFISFQENQIKNDKSKTFIIHKLIGFIIFMSFEKL